MLIKPLTALIVIALAAACSQAPQVMVDGEILEGKRDVTSGVLTFLGVPFAAPPTGELRWRMPQDYVPKASRRDVTQFADACMQAPRIVEWYRDLAELSGAPRTVVRDLSVSEDCLYLNVWTPDLQPDTEPAQSGLPVMVYVHGGSNKSGWAYEPNYHGQELAQQGVVLVSIAYRLGDFGFFAHPEIDGEAAVANFALWDQVAALQWVQQHIAAFGGDPKRVTVFGESAGAENIVALMSATKANNLFRQVILQSTAGFGLPSLATLDDERRRGRKLATDIGSGTDPGIDALRQMPAAEFLQLSEQYNNNYYHSPVLDGVLIESPLGVAMGSNNWKRRPAIVGSNADEYLTSTPDDADIEYVRQQAIELFGADSDAALSALATERDIRQAADRLAAAAYILCPAQTFSKIHSDTGSPLWMYHFSRKREGPVGEQWGAYHGAELPYVFGSHDAWLQTTQADRDITRAMMGYWLQFAAHGNPNIGAAEDWPAYSAPQFLVQDIDYRTKSRAQPDSKLCRLLENKFLGEQITEHESNGTK